MPSTYIEHREGPRGKRYRAVLEYRAGGKRRLVKDKWTRYWKRARLRAEEMRTEAEDIRLGLRKPRARHRWSELVEAWKASRVGRAPATRIRYDQPMLDSAGKFWGDPDLSDITKEQLVRYRESLRADGAAEATVGMRMRALRSCIYFARDQLGWITEAPIKGVEIPVGRDAERIFSDEEYARIFSAAPPMLRGPLILAAWRGMRRQEILMLDKAMLWRDADGDLWVRLRKPTRFGLRDDRDLKTKRKGERDVHLPPEAIPYMDLEGSSGPIFPGLTTTILRNLWEAARAQAGLSAGARWHDWKHTAVTRLLEAGATILDVQRLTGNTLDSLQRYAHIGHRSQKEVTARVRFPSSPEEIERALRVPLDGTVEPGTLPGEEIPPSPSPTPKPEGRPRVKRGKMKITDEK